MAARRKAQRCALCGMPIHEIHVSPYFCAPCDKKRIARINRALAPVADKLGFKDWPTGDERNDR